MASINLKNRLIQVKIVYYGPARGGKTTNLEYIYRRFMDYAKTELVSIKTDGDRTIFFDFLPMDIGKVRGHDVKIQLYTVPGQVMYNATRRLVLKGVDGVVFVADSQTDRQEKNIESLRNLEENLMIQNTSINTIPLVIQYNKRDLEKQGVSLLSFDTLENDLNYALKAPSFMASATQGDNVIETLKKVTSVTMARLISNLQ